MKRWQHIGFLAAIMATAALGLWAPGTAQAESPYAVGADGQRVVVTEGQTVLVAKGATATGAVIRMLFDGKVWKALDCSVTSDGAYWVTGGGTVNSFPGEMRPDCYDSSRGFVVDDAPPAGFPVPDPNARIATQAAPPTVAASTTGCGCTVAPAPAPAPASGPFTQMGAGGYREFGPGIETGVGQGGTWNIEIPANAVLIVTAYEVNGRDHGVYMALMGPLNLTLRMTDGSAQLFRPDQANEEFCRRVNQARQSHWALTYVEPLSGWASC